MICGLCGSGITADEKLKKQKNGYIHRHVYYGCTRSKDKSCKCGHINEKELIKQLQTLIDKIDLDEIGMQEKIKSEVNRFKQFQKGVLGATEDIKIDEVDIRNYAKYILEDGKEWEKRELISCFRSKIYLNTKKIYLE